MKRTLALLAALLLAACEEKPRQHKQSCSVLLKKHIENRSIGFRGDFAVDHYFLYEDGRLERVNLRDYLQFEIGDTLCVTE